MRIKGPLVCLGGKHQLSGWIISHFPEHRTFVDVFGGTGVITLQKDPAPVEVYNDLDMDLVNFFRVLQDQGQFDEFRRRASLTSYSYIEYKCACDAINAGDWESDADRAALYFVANRMAFAGNAKKPMSSGWSKNVAESRRGVAERVSAWLSSVDGLVDFAARFMLVQVECRDFEYVLSCYDTTDTLFYCDPPYYEVGDRMYTCEFSDADHVRLLHALLKLDGMCVLSGYDSDLYYDTLEVGAGWYCASKSARIGTQSASGKCDSRVEFLWINPQAVERLPTNVRSELLEAEDE